MGPTHCLEGPATLPGDVVKAWHPPLKTPGESSYLLGSTGPQCPRWPATLRPWPCLPLCPCRGTVHPDVVVARLPQLPRAAAVP